MAMASRYGGYGGNVKDVRSRSRVTWSGAELLQSRRKLTTKSGEQPWP